MEAEVTKPVELTKEQLRAAKHQAKIQKTQQEYNVICAQLGQSTYKAEAMQWEIEAEERAQKAMKSRLKELNEKATKYAKYGPISSEAEDMPVEIPKEEVPNVATPQS